MRLGTAAYWLSLADQDEQPTGADDTETIAVEVPRSNLLSVETMGRLLIGDLSEAAT
jgi:hypothetical protein